MPGGEEAPMGTDRDALRALAGQGIDLPAAVGICLPAAEEARPRRAMEGPSGGPGHGGAGVAVCAWPGAARTVWGKLDDAALVQRLTGLCHTVRAARGHGNTAKRVPEFPY